ncbi:MAG: hypothetical protein NVSMB12_10160 [Acidimicrobiales bacterium]
MLRVPEILLPSPVPEATEPEGIVRRRRVVVVITIVIGTSFLGGTLAAPQGSARFFVFGALAAAAWLVGGLASGPLHLGARGQTASRPVAAPIVIGAVSFGVFLAADLVARHLPLLAASIHRVLAQADAGSLLAVLTLALVSAVAEEVFFRGALHRAFGGNHPGLYSTITYAAVTVATLNAALVAAALVMGALWSTERRATRGVLAPILSHATWSALMLVALPR